MRKRSIKVDIKNQPILGRIQDLKSDHPFWGYRRVWAYLKYREGLQVNQKRIYRLMKENQFLVKKNQKLRACRTPFKSKPRANQPNQIWGTDMTKIMVSSWGWVYLHVVLDWYTKKIVGYGLSITSKTSDWLNALNMAVNQQYPHGIRDNSSLSLVSDNGCQRTSVNYMAACNVLGIKQIFSSYNNPKGNADTERVMRTIKEDLVWPYEFNSPFELQEALDGWIYRYNYDYPHSSLYNNTPAEFEFLNNQNTILENA